MTFAIYFVLTWSLVGFLAAVLMGRAIAICAGDQHQNTILNGAMLPARTQTEKDLRTAATD